MPERTQPSHQVRITSTKAVVAGLFAGAGTLGASLADGTITLPEVLVAAGAALAGAAATWAAPRDRAIL